MLIVLCLNLYMANCLRIDIHCDSLSAINEQEITLLIVSQTVIWPIIINFLSHIVLFGLNAGLAYVG